MKHIVWKREMLDNSTHKFSSKEANKVLLTLSTAAFLVPFMGSALNLAMPQISKSLSMEAVTLTWVSTLYLLSTAIFQVPFARLADLYGRKRMFIYGIVLFTVSVVLSGLAQTSTAMLITRFLTGLGSAMIFGTNIAILSSVFPPEKRGWALGINAGTVYAALALGPIVGGMLTQYISWRAIFFLSAGVGLFVLLFTRLYLKGEWIEAKGERFDFVGSLLYGAAIFGLIFGFTHLPKITGVVSILVGSLFFVLFGYYELRQKEPIFNLRLFSNNRVFTFSSLSALINYAATSGIGFMLSLYLQYIRELDASHAGLIFIPQAVVQSVASVWSGKLSSRYEPAKIATTGMVIIVVGLLGLTMVTTTTPLLMLIGMMLFLGVGFGIFSAPNTNVIMGSVDSHHYSQASATTGTMRLTGQAFSMGMAGMAISLTMGNKEIVPELFPNLMTAMRLMFVIFIVLCGVGIFFSSVRNRAIKRGG